MSDLEFISYPLAKVHANNIYRKLRHIVAGVVQHIVAGVVLISNLGLAAQTPVSREYQLKAVFIFNFTQFVEWQPSSFPTDQAPIVIGILGKNPFGGYLEDIVSGEKVNGHPVSVQYYSNLAEVRSCHILFINLPEPNQMERVIQDLKDRHTLTVSDEPEFSERGGIIRLFTRDNKIKFQVNLEASKSVGLVLSSKLLRLAEIYVPSKNN